MKPLLLSLLLLIGLPGCTNAQSQSVKDPYTLTISQLPQTAVTDAVIKMEKEERPEIKSEEGRFTATAYFNILECGNYSASAEIKNDSVTITINNSKICDGDRKYYKLEVVIDNPNNIRYKIWADPAFTFLAEGERIQQFRDEHTIGDIDGDKKANSVIIEYEKVVDANDSISNECGRGTCYMAAKFGNGIPDIERSTCYGMTIEALPDLNGDGRDEIIMATHYSHGCCHDMLIWSYDGKKWNLLAEANTFTDEEPDAPRVKKGKKGYYLHYSNWNEEGENIVEKKVKIKTK